MPTSKQSPAIARQHHQGAVGVAAEHRLIEVGLFGLGRHAGGRAGPLGVYHHQRQFDGNGQPDSFRLQGHARAGTGRDAHGTGVGRPDGRTNGRYLVLRLESDDVEMLQVSQCMQQGRGRRDRVGAEEHGQTGQLAARQKAPGKRLAAGDGAIEAGGYFRRLNDEPVQTVGHLRRLAEGMTRVEGGGIRLCDFRPLGELAAEPVDGDLTVAAEHPVDEAQRPHVLAAHGFFVAEAVVLHRLQGHR